jgi:hypothetical protein
MRLVVAAIAAMLLSSCSEPLLVPEAGPNAPNFSYRPPPKPPLPPRVEVLRGPPRPIPASAGAIDSVVRREHSFEISGWALLASAKPRGVLRVILSPEVEASVTGVRSVERPDVVAATSDDANQWAGFTVTLDGTLPRDAKVCVVSRSRQGTFRLGGSDEDLCPA